MNASDSISEPSFNHAESSSPAPGSSTGTLASRDGQEADGPTPNAPMETTNYTTSFSQYDGLSSQQHKHFALALLNYAYHLLYL
jgi:hypothetical protein